MSTVSLWETFTPPPRARVAAPAHFDVVVVGGGITGLTTALLLKQAGRRVCVLEKEQVGSGESAHTSAHLTYVTDLWLSELASRFGEDQAKLVWEAGDAAIDLIERLARDHSIDCGFTRVANHLYSAPTEEKDESKDLRDEQELAVKLGFPAEFLAVGPVAGRPAVRYPNQALFHPLRYIAGLAEAVSGNGSEVYGESEAVAFSDDPLSVTVNDQQITCDDLVIATHVPLTGVKGTLGAMLFQTKLYPYSSYVLHATLPSATIAPGLYNDTDNPYYYLRVHEEDGTRHLVFGGADHKTGQIRDTDTCFAQVESRLTTLFPDAQVRHRWSGQVIESSDGLPFIGEATSHQFIATGYAGNGLTFGTVAAMMARDWLLARPHPLADLLDPSRKKFLSGLASVVAESVDFPYYLIKDRLRPHESDVAAVKPGEGRVLSIDGNHVAVHRRSDNSLVAVSAKCTHLGCLVHWNQGEETWDCPCHGSRFAITGEVIGGPAETPLEAVSVVDGPAAD